MAARATESTITYLPPAGDEGFLKNTVDMLERLREESELHDRHMLASLLAIAKGEAEDDLKTCANRMRLASREMDRNDGAAELAQKFAFRAEQVAQQG
jgi:hypothetical protein